MLKRLLASTLVMACHFGALSGPPTEASVERSSRLHEVAQQTAVEFKNRTGSTTKP